MRVLSGCVQAKYTKWNIDVGMKPIDVVFNGWEQIDFGLVLVIAVLLVISALVSGAEIAFFSLSKNDMKEFSQDSSPAARGVVSLLGDVDVLLATILIVNNIVNVAIVIFAAETMSRAFTFNSGKFFITGVVVTSLLLFFGEIVPKVLSQASPKSFARAVSQPLLLFRRLFYPLSLVLIKAGDKVAGRAAATEISMDELADAVDIAKPTSKEEQGILSGIINFVNTDVSEIMRPRVDITALSLRAPFESVMSTIAESGFSRIPVYDQTLDEIRGVLYVKDLLPHLGDDQFGWQKLIREPYFIPEHKKISDLLEEFQSQKVHLAIVVDEYGSTLGLITLEDIIEEIVGEISDDSDSDQLPYVKIDACTYIFEGRTHIGDFERIMELDEDAFADVRGEAESLAGLIIEAKRSFPKQGDTVVLHQIRFTVEAMGGQGGHRVEKVRVKLPE